MDKRSPQVTFLGDTNAAKPAQGLRIDNVKGQRIVGEAIKDFNDWHSAVQHLIGAHTVCTGSSRLCFTPVQILQNTFADGRLEIDDGADRLQFLGLGGGHDVGHQSHLSLPSFAHFVIGTFPVFVVILVRWCFPICYKQ